MLSKNRTLQILLGILILLIVIASIVMAKMPRQREVVYYNTAPDYDPNLLMLGVRMSKFGGMAIHMDSPAVLLAKSDTLQLTSDQQQGLQAIIHQARTAALALLTEEQRAKISPIPAEPVVLEKMDKTIKACTDGTCSTAATSSIGTSNHVHTGEHDHH